MLYSHNFANDGLGHRPLHRILATLRGVDNGPYDCELLSSGGDILSSLPTSCPKFVIAGVHDQAARARQANVGAVGTRRTTRARGGRPRWGGQGRLARGAPPPLCHRLDGRRRPDEGTGPKSVPVSTRVAYPPRSELRGGGGWGRPR